MRPTQPTPQGDDWGPAHNPKPPRGEGAGNPELAHETSWLRLGEGTTHSGRGHGTRGGWRARAPGMWHCTRAAGSREAKQRLIADSRGQQGGRDCSDILNCRRAYPGPPRKRCGAAAHDGATPVSARRGSAGVKRHGPAGWRPRPVSRDVYGTRSSRVYDPMRPTEALDEFSDRRRLELVVLLALEPMGEALVE